MLKRLNLEITVLFYYWRREYIQVFRNVEALVFFVLLPLAYPILYALIYNPEEVTDVPVAVVDNSRSRLSREIVHNFDATPAAQVIGCCANIDEAKSLMMQRACYAVLVIPEEIDKKLLRNEQGILLFYTDMSLLLNYKSLYMALTDVTLDMGATMRLRTLPIGVSSSITDIATQPVPYTSIVMYNPTSGVASFLIPAVLVLILQQSIVLGIAVLAATRHEQARRWYAPHHIVAQLCGRTLCYLSIYIFNTIYLLHYVPYIFGYPQMGDVIDILLLSLPMILSSVFMASMLSVWVREREHVYLAFVFTSVIFIFLSGIAWPRYAMPLVWRFMSYMVPSTWGIEGFVQINTMGATLAQASRAYIALWLLTMVYGILAVLTLHYECRKSKYKL